MLATNNISRYTENHNNFWFSLRLPMQLQRAMAAEAEATRDARAKVK